MQIDLGIGIIAAIIGKILSESGTFVGFGPNFTYIINHKRNRLDVYATRENICCYQNLCLPCAKRVDYDVALARLKGASQTCYFMTLVVQTLLDLQCSFSGLGNLTWLEKSKGDDLRERI